jgi:hypothetical protein
VLQCPGTLPDAFLGTVCIKEFFHLALLHPDVVAFFVHRAFYVALADISKLETDVS